MRTKIKERKSHNEEYINEFTSYLRIEKRYSENTITAYLNDINQYVEFLKSEDFGDIDEVSKRIAEFYVASLKDDYTPKTINRKISSVNSLYNYFTETTKKFEDNPFKNVMLLKLEKRLPKIIYENEIEDFFKGIDTSSDLGKRDKLIFMLLYTSGLRVSELTALKIKDLNIDDRIIMVHGKGFKDRIVPISIESKNLFKDYLIVSRPTLLSKGPDLKNDYVFLNFKGTRLTSRGVRDILDRIIESESSTLRVSPHTFRHSFATYLLNKGMDARMVQELLGHSSLSTTQIYTKVSKEKLFNEYNKNFPKGDQNKND